MADVVTLIAAASSNGTGATVDFGDIRDEAAVEVQTTGTVSAFSVQLQGSLDGTAWASVGSAVTAATADTPLTSVLARYFRAVLSGYAGTGTVTVKLAAGKT